MSEFRQNPITKQWVLIAPARAKRPEDYKAESVMRGLPEFDPSCVFCPGNEDKNPDLCDDVCRIPKNDDWEVRVIANKYPSLEKGKVYRHQDFYRSRSGYGNHEVLITRKHNEPVALQSIQTISKTIDTLIERMKIIAKDEKVSYVQLFHNHGMEAGASLVHPHYQIMSVPFVPPHIHEEVKGCADYYRHNDSCIYCDIIKEELMLKERIVYENDFFVVMSAYASREPFETWILPKTHSARFELMSEEQKQNLAFVLKDTLSRLYEKLSDPPLNFYVHNMPEVRSSHINIEETSFHWHLTIFPRLTRWAGFEFSTNIVVNPMPPEETAKFLRD